MFSLSYCGSRSSICRSFLSSLEAVVSDCCWKCGFCLSLALLSSFLGYADQNPRDILCPHLPLEGMCRSAVVSRTQDDWQILVHRFQTLTDLMFFRTLQYWDGLLFQETGFFVLTAGYRGYIQLACVARPSESNILTPSLTEVLRTVRSF